MHRPKIVTFLEQDKTSKLYEDIIHSALDDILSKHFFELKDPYHKLKKLLPYVYVKESDKTLSFYSLSKYRASAFKFFFEMISRWLVPGERLNVILIYAVDFFIPELSTDVYTLCEVIIKVDEPEKFNKIKQNFPIIESEIKWGLNSKHFAHKILELKGLTADEKTAYVQERIANLIQKWPQHFTQDIYTEMQHIFLIAPDPFKSIRTVRHLSWLISCEYIFRKNLLKALQDNPQKRTVLVKLMRIEPGKKIGIAVGLNFLRNKEVFEDKQLLKAIHQHLSSIKYIEGSYLLNRRGQEPLTTVYLEIEKTEGRFQQEELKNVIQELPRDLKSHVEYMMHPIFMPRNEEEIMRNILALSQQIKYHRDIPQVFISFDQQSRANLFFTVIVVRLIQGASLPLQEAFKGSYLKYIHDRIKIVGHLRKKYHKEATVFRVKFTKEDFLRADHSIDLYKARQVVVQELSRVVGEFRDFNGGMISKQSELFMKVNEALHKEKVKFHSVMLENFFYSLTPVIMQTLLEPDAFKYLFKLLLDSLKKGFSGKIALKLKIEPHFVYVLILAHERSHIDEIDRQVIKHPHKSGELAIADVSIHDVIGTGYIFRSADEAKKQNFANLVQHAAEPLLT